MTISLATLTITDKHHNHLAFSAFENYVADSNESVKFKLVTCSDDLEEDFQENDTSNTKANHNHSDKKSVTRIESFKPEMSYQFFGQNENIFGYKNLCIKLYYSCARLNIYLGKTYSIMLTKEKTGDIEIDEPLKKISNLYETKVTNNLTEFCSNLSKEKSFVPYGESVQEFSIDYPKDGEQVQKRYFQLFKADNSIPGFTAYHERMQTFLMWYIEAASYIDIDDERWDFFVLYEKLPLNPTTNTESMPIEFQYCFVGYCTIYRYYSYPCNIRPCISQFLILPPFQRIGLGTNMLKSIYSHYNVKSTTDIRVEDPSENFQKMRDILDCTLCQNLSNFSPEKLSSGWSKEMAQEAQEKYKISSRQARRVYEILRLKSVNRKNANEYRSYRLAIKQRLNAPYQKQIKDLERVKPKVPKSEYSALMETNIIPRETRIHALANQYDLIEADYLNVIEKLG
ncbi:hypothetical protein RDWZM_003480 [Blomia tropicalis]|uniref:Histone acetyltransferase type B catalytic subunit n=1 Tax=Blomia tropicalis TaxID=40697 RepID=A0A9Q0RSQ3_BLOTA|nr:hypothetical protein RDWZM_003480 [Blomia tropicalis]